jgi:hypothetical protein
LRWNIKIIEARVSTWENKILSRGGRIVLIKVVLEIIPFYWNSIAGISKGIFTKIHKISFQYLDLGQKVIGEIYIAKWSSIAVIKDLVVWGLK